MVQQTIEDVEKRFLDLRKDYTKLQWNDPKILSLKVDSLASSDLPLAYRLMQRVKNLAPNSESRKKMAGLKAKLSLEHIELLEISSDQTGRKERTLVKINRVLDTAKTTADSKYMQVLIKPFSLFVLIPFFLLAFYQLIWASERYESRTQLILKQPDGMATMDPTMAFLSGFGSTSVTNDNELLKAFILSVDMIDYLERTIQLRSHYKNSKYDMFSRLTDSATKEDLHAYFVSHVSIEIDEKSSVISILAQGFEPDFAHLLAKTIVQRAEWYINEIGHNLAKEQLRFIQKEHQVTESRLQEAKNVLLSFQRKHDLLDPEAEGMALQQITYSLEGEIAKKQAELRALSSGMSAEAPAVMQVQTELTSLTDELESQRSRLTQNEKAPFNNGFEDETVGEILAKFSDLKIDLELALQAYASSQVSLEKSRIEAYRQLKYLIIVESPTLPEESSYPKVFYNLTLFLVVSFMLFLIGRIVIATVNELR